MTDLRTSHDDADESSPSEPWTRRSNIFRALGVMAALAMIAFWIYVFTNVDSIPHPDEFDDAEWSASAEQICAERQAAIAQLPNPGGVETPQERARLVALGTDELGAMLDGLGALGLPDDDVGAEITPQWLVDYELYLSDRRDWTASLAAGDDTAFVISGNAQGVRVTDMLRTVAEVNAMPSCAPSPDA